MKSSVSLSIFGILVLPSATVMAIRKVNERTNAKEGEASLSLNTEAAFLKRKERMGELTATKSSNPLRRLQRPLSESHRYLADELFEAIQERDQYSKAGLGPKHPTILVLSLGQAH